VIRFTAALLLALTLLGPALAVEPNERLADPKLEARARAISGELRCLVCQNESIDESGADLAHDIRVLLRQRLVAGDTDAQAMQYIVDRYGDFVLLKPPVEPATYLLWFGPLALLVAAGAGVVIALRRRRAGPEPPPLDDAEKEKLERLMQEMET
jgi:cytochrome c-type biogenesis protein CcmH